MKLTLLGTGSPVPSVTKCSAGYMVEVGDDVILMDIGPGTVYRLLQAGRKVTDVSHVFLSHLHFDHWLDFIRLVLNRWDTGEPGLAPLNVYGPKGLRDICDRLFGEDGALKLDLSARTEHPQSVAVYETRGGTPPRPWPKMNINEIAESDIITGDAWSMRFANVPHQQPFLISFGMRLEADAGVLAYSSDITCDPRKGPPRGLLELAKDADILIQYLNSIGASPSQDATPESLFSAFQEMIANAAQQSNVKKMITSHHGPKLDKPGVRERIIADIGSIYTGQIVWGEDLQTFQIG